MSITEVIQNNLYVFIAMGVAVVVSVAYAIARGSKMKRTNQSFLATHPNAAKVYLTNRALITSEAVVVTAVNGNAPNHFAEGGKTGFYVEPGISTVEMSYTYTRPGVLHRQVSTTTGLVEQQLETEAYKAYMLGFDRDAERFTFEEVPG